MPTLVVLNGDSIGQEYTWTSERIRIGRLPANDFVVNNASVSGEHCLIERAESGWRVKDLGSTNGTRLNDSHGERVSIAALHRNDVLMIGDISLSVRGDDVPEANPGQVESVDSIPRTTIIMRPQAGGSRLQAEGFSKKSESKKMLNLLLGGVIILIFIIAVALILKLLGLL